MKNFKPKQDFVLVEVVKKSEDDGMAKTKSGILLLNQEEQAKNAGFSIKSYAFEVKDIGPDVVGIQVGDLVLFSDHYANRIDDDEGRIFVLIKEQFIYASYEV